jgi:hypothetical protein
VGRLPACRQPSYPKDPLSQPPTKPEKKMAHTFIEHITSKVIQRIVLTNDPDAHEIDIQFQDRTAFHIQMDVQMRIELVELRDWKDGNGKLIKKFL